MPTVTETIAKTDAPSSGCVVRVLDGEDTGLEVELTTGSIIVGASPEARLRLRDSTVSGQHARITVVADGIEVADVGSRNGTFYLEGRIERAVLPIGATVRFGRTRVMLASRQRSAGPGESRRESYGALLGSAPSMRRLYATLEQLEKHAYPVLILGETGVGKELVAREIHEHSKRHSAQYEVCDCTTLPANLVESELFGHVRGAFTGAVDARAGVFERADGGTIFLDEIGELPLDLQPKLLRILETGELRRVGSGEVRKVDVRVIAATNRDLLKEARAGRFREDLLYRLNAVSVDVPPLRSRREDIPALVKAFIRRDKLDDSIISAQTLELFTTGYDWPGNARELRNAVRRVLALGTLPPEIDNAPSTTTPATTVDTSAQFQDAKRRIVDAFERDYLSEQLRRAGDNITHAARASGVERMAFKRLLKKHDLI